VHLYAWGTNQSLVLEAGIISRGLEVTEGMG
jgi:hypothetical protein